MTESSFFKLSIQERVATLALNRPDKANSMNAEFWRELPTIIKQLDQNTQVRALVLYGEGKHFSSGIDLGTFASLFDLMNAEPGRAALAMQSEIARLQEAINAVENTRLPVIAAIHGVCMGAGIDLISACDMRLASQETRFSIEEVNIGMAADLGTLQRLPKLMPLGIVKELAFSGRMFNATEARSWGLINSTHADFASCLQAAHSLALDIAEKSPLAIAGTKRAINYARDHSVADSLEQIATWNAGALRPQDLLGSIEARKQNKTPNYDDLLSIDIEHADIAKAEASKTEK